MSAIITAFSAPCDYEDLCMCINEGSNLDMLIDEDCVKKDIV